MLFAFALLFRALIAAIVEQLPAVVGTLRAMMPDEVREFVHAYRRLVTNYSATMLRVPEGEPVSGELIDRLRNEALNAVVQIVAFWFKRRVELNVNASFLRLRTSEEWPNPDERVLYSDHTARDQARFLELAGWARQVPGVPEHLLIAIDEKLPHRGAPAAVVFEAPDIVPNSLDRDFWRSQGLSENRIDETVGYFEAVPFRSFFSMPVKRIGDGRIVGALTVQVDRPNVFVAGNDDTNELVDLIEPFCYFFAWLETKRDDATETFPLAEHPANDRGASE